LPHPALVPSSEQRVKRLLDAYYRLLQILITLLMFVLIVPVSMQIFSRYTGGLIPRYIWTEEIARFCFIWIVMIGAMIAVRDGTHFDVDVLPHAVSARVEGALRLFVHCAMLLASAIFLIYGWKFAQFGALQYSEIAGLPMLTIYIAWPLAGASMVLFLFEKFIEDVRVFRGRVPPPRHEIPKAE
jgi:TRAP-type transport system small permease protein